MTLKDINFSIDMYGTSAIATNTYQTVFTGDEDSVQLKFAITDEADLTGATALIHLYFGDSSHFERICTPITGGFQYTLTGTENDHAGITRVDIYITKAGAKFTRAGYKFRIDKSLEASAPLVEYAVDTVDTVVKEAGDWLSQAQTDFGTAQGTRAAEWVADNDTRADDFNAAQISRANAFSASEAARTSTFNANETGRSNTFTVNENARQEAAEANQAQAATDHTTAEADHGIAVADSSLASSDHATAAADHNTAATDHSTASADHAAAIADQEIVDGLQDQFDDVIANATVDSEVINARQGSATLGQNILSLKAQLEHIVTYETFPTDIELSAMAMGSVFEVKRFSATEYIDKCMYIKTNVGKNMILKTGFGIKPLTNCTASKVFLPYLGILSGEANAVSNSAIMASIDFSFGCTLELPSGLFYFDRPLNLSTKQMSLRGFAMSPTKDKNTHGLTWVVFKTLLTDEAAITIGTGTLNNLIISGGETQYVYTINREKTYIDKFNIESETYTVQNYGLKGGSLTSINNVHIIGFYYGAYLNTSNTYINNFFVSNCHYGLSVGNDTKINGLFGWGVHTLLQVRGSIVSAIQVRGDSLHHLVELKGYMHDVYLADLDGDYCIGSILTMGTEGVWATIDDLYVNGIRGRACVLNAYDTVNDVAPTADSIPTASDVSEWGFISVKSNTNLKGAIFVINSKISQNPKDVATNYLTPEILFAFGTLVIATGINVLTTFKSKDGDDITRDVLTKSIKLFSTSVNNASIALNNGKGVYYLNRHGSVVTTTKSTKEALV